MITHVNVSSILFHAVAGVFMLAPVFLDGITGMESVIAFMTAILILILDELKYPMPIVIHELGEGEEED